MEMAMNNMELDLNTLQNVTGGEDEEDNWIIFLLEKLKDAWANIIRQHKARGESFEDFLKTYTGLDEETKQALRKSWDMF